MSRKKFFTLLLALVTALTMSLAGTALAADTWDGTVGTVPAPVNNVITITTGAQLAGLAANVNDNSNEYAGVTIRLGDDINLNNLDWRPIGIFFAYGNTGNRAFRGIFDGAGHNITGLNVLNDQNNWSARGETAALFGYIQYYTPTSTAATRATVPSPAALAEADVASLGLTGAAAAKVRDERIAAYNDFGISESMATTRSTRIVNPSATGGIVKNVRVYGTVRNTYGQGASGVVCWNDGTVMNCYFEGSVESAGTGRAYAGGISSLLGANTDIVNCVASADVRATGGSFSYAGGIAGYCYQMNLGYIVNCSVEPGSVIFSYMDTGGIAGGFAYQVYNCSSAAASVTVNGQNPNESGHYTGGIVGAYGSAFNCSWLQTSGSTTQPGYAVGGGTSTTGLVSTVSALPKDSVLFGPLPNMTIGGTEVVAVSYYPTGAGANTPTLAWSSSSTSVASVSDGTVTASGTGTAIISAAATQSGWTFPSAVSGGVSPQTVANVTATK